MKSATFFNNISSRTSPAEWTLNRPDPVLPMPFFACCECVVAYSSPDGLGKSRLIDRNPGNLPSGRSIRDSSFCLQSRIPRGGMGVRGV